MKKYLFMLAGLTAATLSAQQLASPVKGIQSCQMDCSLKPILPRISLRGVPAYPMGFDQNKIYNSDKVYVYRLAICITPEVMRNSFQNDKAKANEWLNEVYKNLNEIYPRDLSIRFDEVRNDKLLLTENTTGLDLSDNRNGTKAIDKLIGTENYDVGILIILNGAGGSAGMATHGGAGANTGKANAYANTDPITVAHELGHLFGAQHVHQCNDSFLLEPGKGQSVMSYGAPCNFFSLPSIMEIRKQLSEQNYYLDSSRTPEKLHIIRPVTEHDNYPYVEDAGAANVKIDHKAIRDEYVVTLGTHFQLYVPTEGEASSTMLYAAQPYDLAAGVDYLKSGKISHTSMPAYAPQKGNSVMFQPYFDEPYGGSYTDKQKNQVPYSGDFSLGVYTYLLGAYDRGRYDTHITKVRVVEGEEFRVTSYFSKNEYKGGEPISIKWQTCQSLYGKNSKVRILLSDDFGQTFKYVLADDVPNNGSWDGFMPFIKIDKVNYRNLKSQIRGGVFKVEVKGEAAYALTHKEPYYTQGRDVIYTGGFTLAGTGNYVLFRDASNTGQTLPEPYLVVNSESEIPEMKPLEAYHKNNAASPKTVQGTEVRHGNHIRREWKCTLNGSTAAYTQVIIVNSADTDAITRTTAENLRSVVKDLLTHIGEVGYPNPELPSMQQLEVARNDVYDVNFVVKDNLTAEAVHKIETLVKQISAIKIHDVVKPKNGARYLIRNYRSLFGKDLYFYIAQNENVGWADPFVDTEAAAVVWTCEEANGQYKFVANGRNLYIGSFNSIPVEITLERGSTWGSFTLVNNKKTIKMTIRNDNTNTYRVDGTVVDYNPANPEHQYLSSTHSGDFQFVAPKGGEIGKVSIQTEEKYGTLFMNTPYIMPSGLTGYVVKQTDAARQEVKLTQAFASGEVVPANVALVLKGEKGTYTLHAPKQAPAVNTDITKGNLLQGSMTEASTVAPNGQQASDYYFYKLYYNKSTGTPKLGFYWGASDGGVFTTAAQRAYLALPRQAVAAGILGFGLPSEGGTTGIEQIVVPTAKPGVYTLSGVRLNPRSLDELPAGIYIINGKKKVIQ